MNTPYDDAMNIILAVADGTLPVEDALHQIHECCKDRYARTQEGRERNGEQPIKK